MTWLLDESWPAALALGTVDGGSETLQGWAWPPDYPCLGVERAVADGVGIVVQSSGGIAWVRREGATVVSVEGGETLLAVDAECAWLGDFGVVDPGHPPDPPPQLLPGRIVAAHRDGSCTTIATPTAVQAIAVQDGRLWVSLAQPSIAYPRGPDSWSFGYPRRVVTVSREALLADGLTDARPASTAAPSAVGVPRGQTWLEGPEIVLRYGVHAGGLVWWAGAPPDGDRINRQVLLIGHEPGTGSRVVRVDLGIGQVRDLAVIDDEVWLVIARRRWLKVSRDHGVEVVAVSPSGAVRTVLTPDSIDISAFTPPLHRPPAEEIHTHIEHVRSQFEHLETYWRSESGTTSPLSEGLSDPHVAVHGEWPDTSVVVTFRHRRRPGLTLRRTLRLFDDAGSPIEQEHAVIHLMEDLDTHYIAPADEAIDGVLDT